ncbi:MAG: ribonuclease E, partial [Geobacteraceae bacterium]|nr:ribonuclease E [Geobacteraceae bacterium]
RISQFGMMEMSRQRIAKKINDAIHLECPHGEGRGRVKSVEAMAVSFLRKVHAAAAKGQIAEVRGGLPLEVAYFLLNRKKRELAQIENDYEIVVTIKGKPSFLLNQLELETVRKEKQREELPELDLSQQSPAVELTDSVVTTAEAEGAVAVETTVKKRRKRKRKKKTADRSTDAISPEQIDAVPDSLESAEPVAVVAETATPEPVAEQQEPAAKKRRRSRSRKKPSLLKEAEVENSEREIVDTSNTAASVQVSKPDNDEVAAPVKTPRPKRAVKKPAVAIGELAGVGEVTAPAAESVAEKPAAKARKSSARKKTTPQPAAVDGEKPAEDIVVPKARKRPAAQQKKKVSGVADADKE